MNLCERVRTIEKQSWRPLNVPIVLILYWALYEERDFHSHYQMVDTLLKTMCTSTSSVNYKLYLDQSKLMAYDERACPFNELLLINHDKRIFLNILNIFCFFNGKDKIWIGCTNWRMKIGFSVYLTQINVICLPAGNWASTISRSSCQGSFQISFRCRNCE